MPFILCRAEAGEDVTGMIRVRVTIVIPLLKYHDSFTNIYMFSYRKREEISGH
jgi:hypothetical protein